MIEHKQYCLASLGVNDSSGSGFGEKMELHELGSMNDQTVHFGYESLDPVPLQSISSEYGFQAGLVG